MSGLDLVLPAGAPLLVAADSKVEVTEGAVPFQPAPADTKSDIPESVRKDMRKTVIKTLTNNR